jgi:Flp pilus assembly CpaF family ATPase
MFVHSSRSSSAKRRERCCGPCAAHSYRHRVHEAYCSWVTRGHQQDRNRRCFATSSRITTTRTKTISNRCPKGCSDEWLRTDFPFLKPIEHLILEDSITEVMVNGPDDVFVEKEGFLQEVPGVSLGERSLMVAVKNIARRLGGDVSEAKPILDSRWPDGSRVAAVIPPCSLTGITLAICKFSSRHFEIEDLIRAGTLDRALANRLEDYVLSRKNLLVSGGPDRERPHEQPASSASFHPMNASS